MITPVLSCPLAETHRQLGVLHGYLRAHHAPEDVMAALSAITAAFDDEADGKEVNLVEDHAPAYVPPVLQVMPELRPDLSMSRAIVGGSGNPEADETQRVDNIAAGRKRQKWADAEKQKCWKLYVNGEKPKAIARALQHEFGTDRDNVAVSAMLQILKKEGAEA